MSNSSGNLIDQATSNSTLTNVNNTIQGSGDIGNGLSLNNQSLIDANQSITLVIDAPAISNWGTLKATGGGTLEILNSSATNTYGTISTDGSSSSVIIEGSGIIGGNLTSTNGAEIHGTGGSALDGVTITTGSTFSVDPGPDIYLTGNLTNDGTVLIGNSGGSGGELVIDAPTVYLSGGGTVILNNAGSQINANPSSGSDTLVNDGSTIQGQGIQYLEFINQGTVNANVAGGTLTIQAPNPQTPITNTGTLEATGGGTLYFLNSTVINTNATISTDGSSSSVILNGSGIIGGNLTSTNGAVIHGTNNSALGGVTITSGSTFSVDPGANFYLTGDLTNMGTVVVGNSGGSTNLVIDAPTVTLSGGGTVILNNGYSHLEGNGTTPSPTLVNTDNTIQGQGIINSLNFINQATVDANVPGGTNNALNIEAPTTNTGTLKATGEGILYFYGATVNNTNGTISTDGSSSVIINDSAIIGGDLTSASVAEIHAISNSALDGVTITSGSTLSVDAGNNVYLTGDLTNNGTVVVGDSGNGDNANLVIDAPTVTLSGSGTVDLANAYSYLEGNGTVPTLLNQVNTMLNQGNTIVGPGTVLTYTLEFSDVTTVPPTATTQAATGVTPTAATLNGGVNPHGSITSVYFVYGTTDSPLTTGTTTAAELIGSGTSAVAVTTALTGLLPGTTYYYEVVATSAGGTTDGGPILSFTTLAPPFATTQAASDVTTTAAMLNGSVNPLGEARNGLLRLRHRPLIDDRHDHHHRRRADRRLDRAVAVTAALTGLLPGTTYYKVVATGAGGHRRRHAPQLHHRAACVDVDRGGSGESVGGRGTHRSVHGHGDLQRRLDRQPHHPGDLGLGDELGRHDLQRRRQPGPGLRPGHGHDRDHRRPGRDHEPELHPDGDRGCVDVDRRESYQPHRRQGPHAAVHRDRHLLRRLDGQPHQPGHLGVGDRIGGDDLQRRRHPGPGDRVGYGHHGDHRNPGRRDQPRRHTHGHRRSPPVDRPLAHQPHRRQGPHAAVHRDRHLLRRLDGQPHQPGHLGVGDRIGRDDLQRRRHPGPGDRAGYGHHGDHRHPGRRDQPRRHTHGHRRSPPVDRPLAHQPHRRQGPHAAVHRDRHLLRRLDGQPHQPGHLGVGDRIGGDDLQRRRHPGPGDRRWLRAPR